MKTSPRDIEESNRQITRRTAVIGGLFAANGAVLAGRMRYLQLVRADDFRLLAEENVIRDRLIAPERGLIFDRNGVLLAGNEQIYRITLVRENIEDLDEIIARLDELITLDLGRVERARRELERGASWVGVPIADRLSWQEFSAVSVNAPALPGVYAEVGMSRIYPLGADFAHVVGYVRNVPQNYVEDTGDTDPLLSIPDFQVGLLNVEEGMEPVLRGQAGIRRIEQNASGREMREISRREAAPGEDVQLSVDAGLQNYVEARLDGESAGAVVIDCTTGDILALASAPTYDPSIFTRPLSGTVYNGLLNDPYRPLVNKATQGQYPPGSTYKMIVALAALEGGFITPNERISCTGSVEVGNRDFNCWRRGGHGAMDLFDSLSQSCDVYYYELAQRVGIENITAMARRLGCGIRHELPLSAVAEGLTPTMAWKQRRIGEAWVVGDTLNAAIGQGYVLTSPLQLAVMIARIASGRVVEPRIVRSTGGLPSVLPPPPRLDINPEHLELVREGMFRVNNAQRGTAFGSRVMDDAYGIAGKTGTSQVRGLVYDDDGRVIPNSELPWEDRDHALYVGYGPVEAPRYAVSVVVEHGSSGAASAAPIARDILLRAQVGDVPPPELYPVSQRRGIEAMHERLNIFETPPQPTGREPNRA